VTVSANRTASRTCRTQYSGLVRSPTVPIFGWENVSVETTSRKSSSIGSISGE
jgi:hypothetical protein